MSVERGMTAADAAQKAADSRINCCASILRPTTTSIICDI